MEKNFFHSSFSQLFMGHPKMNFFFFATKCLLEIFSLDSRLKTHLDLGEYSFKETLDSILFWASLGTGVWILLIRPNRASCVLPEGHLEYQCG